MKGFSSEFISDDTLMRPQQVGEPDLASISPPKSPLDTPGGAVTPLASVLKEVSGDSSLEQEALESVSPRSRSRPSPPGPRAPRVDLALSRAEENARTKAEQAGVPPAKAAVVARVVARRKLKAAAREGRASFSDLDSPASSPSNFGSPTTTSPDDSLWRDKASEGDMTVISELSASLAAGAIPETLI